MALALPGQATVMFIFHSANWHNLKLRLMAALCLIKASPLLNVNIRLQMQFNPP